MASRSSLFLAAASLSGLVLILSGCGLDIQEGSQFSGQECFENSDCVSGLVCSQRRCRPVATGQQDLDAGPTEDADPDDTGPRLDTGLPPDTDLPECTEGARRCASETAAEVCLNGQWTRRSCDSSIDEVCQDGYCMSDTGVCQPGQSICLNDETVGFCTGNSWDIVEVCQDGQTCADATCIDDPSDCCPGGCGSGEICDACTCQEYDIDVCQFQDQPCNQEEQISNNYVCARYGDQSQLRCFGICNTGAADPDASCPGTGERVCLNQDEGPNGLCMSACTIDDGCADSRMGCLYYDVGPGDGLCIPVSDTGELGDSCDGFDTFSCTGSNMCIQDTCVQSCRPFTDGDTDCGDGYCLAFDSNLGMCTPSSELPNGGCNQQGTTCNGDATGCFPGGFGAVQCYDFCRLSLGDSDCSSGETCWQYEAEQTQLGICTSNP